MPRSKAVFPLALLGLLSLSSCNLFGLFPEKGGDTYIPPDRELHLSPYSEVGAYNLALTRKRSAIPSQGDIKTLVIPVQFSDFPFQEGELDDLEIAFNGTSEDTRYWESVSSFYYKSSFGKLSLEATIAPIFEAGTTDEYIRDYGSTMGVNLLREAVANYKRLGGDPDSFDNDGDGYIDAVYLIYSAPYYSSDEGVRNNLDDDFWAYTYWDRKGSHGTPESYGYALGDAFVFASVDFMFQGSRDGVDAHTYIHETGHLLGLNDYYNYDLIEDNQLVAKKYRGFCPVGGFDMMDFNILDHNVYSKWLLGWNTPYVLDHNVELPLTISLEASYLSGSFLAIPSRSSDYLGSPFDEYIIVETYQPEGLNFQDSYINYCSHPLGFSIPGVKIYHVDARLFKRVSSSASPVSGPITLEELEREYTTGIGSYYTIGASNTPSEVSAYGLAQGCFEIHLMESNGVLTFDKGTLTDYATASNSTMFSGLEGHNVFDMEKFRSFFVNGDLFNSGKEFGYKITVNGFTTDENGVVSASITLEEDDA